MNNLLRTLTNSQAKNASGTDLKLLLTSVKEARKQASDSKYTDAFFDSLEGVLLDLRTVTIDNRDAEAFLKPVTKSEVPDYYDVIHNPMDLQTMMKRVKQKQYKSKREFKDDLDLIWSNCRTYNAAENHPLRECVRRLEIKAEKLLANITDRKERVDPTIPFATNGTTKMVNGHPSKSRHSSPSSSNGTPARVLPPLTLRKHAQQPSSSVNFEDSPALVRTPTGMALFRDLDRQVQDYNNEDDSAVIEKLRDLTAPHFIPDAPPEHEDYQPADGFVGDKRKLNGSGDNHPRKRARYTPSTPLALYPTDSTDVTALWWGATQSNTLLANGLPLIPCISSSASKRSGKRPLFPIRAPPGDPSVKPKVKRKRKALAAADSTPPPPKALLTMMNSNIHTIKRVRRAHAKYAALGLTAAGPANEDGETDGAVPVIQQPIPLAFPGGAGTADEDLGVGAVIEDTTVDERAWKIKRGGVEIGAENADSCLNWVNGKILHHAGFQGGSKNALSVMSSVLGEYLTNFGQTIKYMSEKHANTMTSEEIILHTLFESGVPKIQDLEQYISDDIERHGGRLADLEKKIVGAYTEATATDVVNEDLFDENEEEDGAFLLLVYFHKGFMVIPLNVFLL
jgi:transcriptional activator SPT7